MELSSVVFFFSSGGVKPIEIHWHIKVQYGDAWLALQEVYEWSRKFQNDLSSVSNSPRSGQVR